VVISSDPLHAVAPGSSALFQHCKTRPDNGAKRGEKQQ
jgi:hypothetical protein